MYSDKSHNSIGFELSLVNIYVITYFQFIIIQPPVKPVYCKYTCLLVSSIISVFMLTA